MRVVTGFHAIEEKIRAAGAAEKIELLYARPGPRVKKILELARKSAVRVQEVLPSVLDEKTAALPKEIRDHRGIVMLLDEDAEVTADFDVFLRTLEKETATVLVLDGITDPHNMGAIIRSCDQFCVDLVIVPSRGSANNSEIIERSSAGASAWVPVAVVPNLTRAAEKLKEAGFWIYGADAQGDALPEAALPPRTALVMGSEGAGISRLLKTSCDAILSIPAAGKIDSLNVSVAAGIFLYEIYKRRR